MESTTILFHMRRKRRAHFERIQILKKMELKTKETSRSNPTNHIYHMTAPQEDSSFTHPVRPPVCWVNHHYANSSNKWWPNISLHPDSAVQYSVVPATSSGQILEQQYTSQPLNYSSRIFQNKKTSPIVFCQLLKLTTFYLLLISQSHIHNHLESRPRKQTYPQTTKGC